MEKIKEILNEKLRKSIEENVDIQKITEIRLRINKPLIIYMEDEEVILNNVLVEQHDIKEIFDKITGYSAYAYQKNISEGYMSISGGHRIGFGGEIVTQNNKIETIKNISFMNIRVCHSVQGCSDSIYDKVKNGKLINNTLIISPPGMGKTTLLRDLVKKLSMNISGTSICIIDERNEISGSYMGVPQIDLGMRTDIISNCAKEEGIKMGVRSMSPKIIAVDEIGSREDIEALKYAVNSGVNIIATIHGDKLEDVKYKLGQAIDIFKIIVLIKKRGEYICL